MGNGKAFGLSLGLIDKISAALNVALSVTLLHAPEMHAQIMEAALGLDEEAKRR